MKIDNPSFKINPKKLAKILRLKLVSEQPQPFHLTPRLERARLNEREFGLTSLLLILKIIPDPVS